mmetsp:Transcript_76378/g.224013  ORF Transcript_76378/g.224013 Transcript_76378/m.224013 type:complete len:225 (+) Transcript_76378:1084-1758(+)
MERNGSAGEDPLHAAALPVPLAPRWIDAELEDDSVVDPVGKEDLRPRIPEARVNTRRAVDAWLPEVVAQAAVGGLEEHAGAQDQPDRVPPRAVEGRLPLRLALDDRLLRVVFEDGPALLVLHSRQHAAEPPLLQPHVEQEVKVDLAARRLSCDGTAFPRLGDLAPERDQRLRAPDGVAPSQRLFPRLHQCLILCPLHEADGNRLPHHCLRGSCSKIRQEHAKST